MTARLIKKPNFVDESGNPIHRTYHFQVVGTVAPSTAKALAEAYYGPVISTPYGVLFRGPGADAKSIAYNQFDVDVEYITRPAEIGSWSWDGDGTGQTQHITHSLETIEDYPTATAPASNRCIGRNRNGDITGTDIIVPAGKLSITFTHPSGVMTLAYFKYLQGLAGYVNSANFLAWAAGEVRFLGARVQDGSQTQSSCVYSFDLSPNATGLSVGTITGITKAGWHVLHVEYKDDTETVGGVTYPVTKPQFAHVERVSPTINFSTAFGIS